MKARHQGPRPQRCAARSGPFSRTEDNPEFHFKVYVQAKLRVHRSSGFIAAAIGVAKKKKKKKDRVQLVPRSTNMCTGIEHVHGQRFERTDRHE